MSEKRGSWHLLTGLILGVLIGVVVSSFLIPARYVDTSPSLLSVTDRNIYRGLIARAYLVEADLERAVARLNLLGDVNLQDALVAQAQQQLSEGGNEADSRALALLAAAVEQGKVQITPLPRVLVAATSIPAPVTTKEPQNTPTIIPATRTFAPTVTPHPTVTPQPTQGLPYELVEQKEICDPAMKEPLIRVYVYNRADKPIAGVRIEISVPNGGVEAFYTGLFPEINAGYADYAMVEGMTYNLRVGVGGQLVQNLSIPDCETEEGTKYPGSIQLTFKKPD